MEVQCENSKKQSFERLEALPCTGVSMYMHYILDDVVQAFLQA